MTARNTGTSSASLMLLALLAACGSEGSEEEPNRRGVDEPAPLAAEPAPELDLDTSRADTPAGEIEAQRVSETTYVGAVTDELHIAVTLSSDADAGASRRALVYLCDGQMAEYLSGEIGRDATTLQGHAMDVELALVDGAITGTVVSDGEEPRPFTANEASGDAGLYVAKFSLEGFDYRPVWIVLPDGSQRGGACWQCCDGERCYVCCPTTAETMGLTVDWSELQYWWVEWFQE